MKSLIIGAAGFAGAYLIRHLQQAACHTVVATKMPQEQILVPDAKDHPPVVYDLDILEQNAVIQLFQKVQPDYVFHLAAQSSVAAAWKMPGRTVDVNIRGAVNVLEAFRGLNHRARMVLTGSGEEYGQVSPEDIPIREDSRMNPGNIYAATKACQNMLGSIYARAYGLEVVMVRAFNHVGPNQSPLFVVSDFCRQVARIEAGLQEPVIRTGNLDVRRDFTDVRDVVRAYELLAVNGRAGETYNVGSGRAVRIADILQMILKKSSADIRVENDPSKMRPTDLPVIEADIKKLQKTTGWQPLIRLEQTIEETLHYWRTRGDL